MKKEVKVLYLLLILLWANVFVCVVYLSLSENTQKTNKEVLYYKKILNR